MKQQLIDIDLEFNLKIEQIEYKQRKGLISISEFWAATQEAQKMYKDHVFDWVIKYKHEILQ